PALKDIGKQAAEEMNGKLGELDKFVGKKEEELQQKLADKQKAAIQAIDQKIEKMKEAMAGALAKLGKLLLWAAKKFFTWALEKVGFSLADSEGIINKGVAVLKAIFTKPIQFVKNLVRAAITGFENFGKNFLKHLKDALFEWLTGSLEGLQLPSTWDFKGIIGVALQMIGISYANIRRHMVAAMGEPVVAGLEKTFELVKTLITEGPMAAWDQLKEMAGEMRDAFVQAIKDFIKQKIIEQAIQWIVSLFVPGAGIIKAIIGIYDTVVFFIQKAKQIMKMISNFLSSISEIAAGNIGAAAEAMESGLARGLSLVINFLAALLRLSGVTAKIREAIQSIRAKVDGVLSRIANWIATKAKALISKGVSAVKAGATAVVKWWKMRKAFKIGREPHELYMEGEAKNARLFIKSTPQILESVLPTLRRGNPKGAKLKAIETIEFHAKKINKIKDEKGDSFGQAAGEEIMKSLTIIADNFATAGLSAVPKSSVDFGTRSVSGDAVGNVMTANPLSIDPAGLAGSGPHQETRLWVAVNQRPNVYGRGHLLNHHVHGPGENRNVVPITGSYNTTMETQAEHVIKKAVIGEGKVVRFIAKAKGKQGPRKHIPQESELPEKIVLNAVELEEGSDGKWKTEGKSLLKDKEIPNTLPKDEPVGTVHIEVNLSTARRAQLDTVDGIGPVLADR